MSSRSRWWLHTPSSRVPWTGILPILVGLLLWQALARADSLSFPPPSQWWSELMNLHRAGQLLPAALDSVQVFALAFAISLIAGTLLGLAIGSSLRVDRAFSPILEFFRNLPSPTLIPLATLVLGVATGASVFIVVSAAIWPVLLNAVSARRAVPSVRMEMARDLGLGRWERIHKVIVPGIVPRVMVGARVSVAFALIVTLVVDIIGSGEGLGRTLIIQQQQFNSAAVWGVLAVVGVASVVVNLGMAALERHVTRNW